MNSIVIKNNDKPVTTSRLVAEKFGKMHKNVIQAIEKIQCSEEFKRLNFQPVEYEDKKGEKRKEYIITRDGFVFLAMGFTGKIAARFKEDYINAFNKMESLLRVDQKYEGKITDHTNEEYQKLNSKKANAKMFLKGGVKEIKEYNQNNCKYHTGKSTSEVKQIGKNKGLKSKDRQSAKAVIRKIEPARAACMSFTDRLVVNKGIDHEKAASTSLKLALPLFKELEA